MRDQASQKANQLRVVRSRFAQSRTRTVIVCDARTAISLASNYDELRKCCSAGAPNMNSVSLSRVAFKLNKNGVKQCDKSSLSWCIDAVIEYW